jgi:hypothetical protein
MADEYNADLNEDRHRQIMDMLKEIRTDVKATNGRVNVLERKVDVLEERNPGKQGGAWGAVAGALGGFLAGFIKP